jgi:hypothetical protein
MNVSLFASRRRLGTILATLLLSGLLLAVLFVAPSPAMAQSAAGGPTGWSLAALIAAPASGLLAIRAVRAPCAAMIGYLALGLGFVLSMGGFGLARLFRAR